MLLFLSLASIQHDVSSERLDSLVSNGPEVSLVRLERSVGKVRNTDCLPDHSMQHIPINNNVDVPTIFADHCVLEALARHSRNWSGDTIWTRGGCLMGDWIFEEIELDYESTDCQPNACQHYACSE
jgi:hypothetical protein